jgi:hypothetical protein
MADRRIRIESGEGPKGGETIRVVDPGVSERLSNIASILIRIEEGDVVVADVTYHNGASERRYVGEINVTILAEVVDGSTN